jgi:hypothetical protein
METVEALTFQDTYTYREGYLDGNRVDVKAKKELNAFLWVREGWYRSASSLSFRPSRRRRCRRA